VLDSKISEELDLLHACFDAMGHFVEDEAELVDVLFL